jgi:hypothetical protein
MREKRTYYDVPGVGKESFLFEFTSADVLSNIVTIRHNMGMLYPSVTVYDNTKKQIIPDEVTVVNENTILLDITNFVPISGNWFARILG